MEGKDPFGFPNQGPNYEQFRPQYPESLVSECVRGLPSRLNYLDVAMGTGQVFFSLCGRFSGTAVGSDISDQMLQVARDKADQLQQTAANRLLIEKKDCLAGYGDLRFDLTTVGEALHWFDVGKFLPHARSLLAQGGRLSVLAYYTVDLQPVPAAPASRLSSLYRRFMDRMVTYIQSSDVRGLEEQYTSPKYSFQEHFGEVRRLQEVVTTTTKTEDALRYFKTFSGYNICLQTGVDLLEELQQEMAHCGDAVELKTIYFGVYCTQ